MLNVRLSRESLLFYQQNKMNARGLNPSGPVLRDDIHQDISNFGFTTPIVSRTRISQIKPPDIDEAIQGVIGLPNASRDLHKGFSASVLCNTPSPIVQIALEKPQSEYKVSKKKVAKGKTKNSSHLLNASESCQSGMVKVDKKQNSKQRIKSGAIKRSAVSTQEPIAVSELADTPTESPLLHDLPQPATKRSKVFSDWNSLSATIESVVAASAENVSLGEESDQTSKVNLKGKTSSEAQTKQLAKKSALTIGTKPVNNGRKEKEVPTDRVAGRTEQSTSVLNGSMSPKQSLGKSPSKPDLLSPGLNDKSFSIEAIDTDVSIESENETCSSASDGEEDPIFSRDGSYIKKRDRIGSIISEIFGTPRRKKNPSESSLSSEFDYKHKLSKSLPGLILPAARKPHSLYEHSLEANRDPSTVETENPEHRKEVLIELAQNKKSQKITSTSKLETSNISASVSKTKEGVTRKPVENGELTPETPHLEEYAKPSDGSPALKRKGSTSFTKTLSPNKKRQVCLSTSQYNQPPVVEDSDTFEDVQETPPTQRSIMPRTDKSILPSPNNKTTLSSISAQCNTELVPAELPKRFNFYMAPPGYPVRARQLMSTEDFLVSWLDLEPTVIFPLQTLHRTMIMRLKGSIEFRSNPFVPSRTLVNSASKMVELEAGALFHIVNTGEEVASFQITEVLQ